MKTLTTLSLLVSFALVTPLASSHAQQPPPPATPNGGETLPVEIGRASGKGGGDGASTSYAVFATAPLDSAEKGQRLQFVTRESGPGRTATAYTIVNTGKSKTLGQLAENLGSGLRRFAGGGGAAGQEFAKVGDIRYGGELRLVAVGTDSLRFQYNPPTARPVTFTRADAGAFASILGR